MGGTVGDPDRGFDAGQPGGWVFVILPYIEEQNLFDMGKGMTGTQKEQVLATRDATPITIMNCPSRREAKPYENSLGFISHQSAYTPVHARSDYAVNVGNETGYNGHCDSRASRTVAQFDQNSGWR